jgi:hypothetical protein
MNNIVNCIWICLLSFFGFSSNSLSREEKVVYQVMSDFAENKINDGLEAVGTGLAEEKVGEKKGKLKLLKMSFQINNSLTINTARKIGIDIVNQFLSYVNNNKKLEPFLIECPLTEKNVRISISGKNCDETDNTCVKSVSVGEGYVRYYSNEITPPNHGLILKETYEEAVAKLKITHP